MAEKKQRTWLSVGGFTILGFALLWLANELWLDVTEIAGSTSEMPSGRLLIWLTTLVVVGFVFGLALEEASGEQRKARISVLLTWSVIPFVVLFYFWAQVAMGWLPVLPDFMFQFLYSEITLTGSGIALGFFVAGMVGRIILSDTPEEPEPATPEEPEPTTPEEPEPTTAV